MKQEGLTVRGAAEMWANEMDAIWTRMIDKLMACDPDDWNEVTMPSTGTHVYVFDEGMAGEITKVPAEGEDMYTIQLENEKEITCEKDDFEPDAMSYGALPMWSVMWSFHDSCDVWWMEHGDGIRMLSECGFRVYYSEEFGYFFGIDGGGYDFYEEHWIPLYRKRGLQWYDPATEMPDKAAV